MLPDSYLTGKWMSLEGIDRSWRDVSNVEPGMVSVFRIRFKYTNGDAFPFEVRGGLFVMHCHILEHEDNDMMRYFSVA